MGRILDFCGLERSPRLMEYVGQPGRYKNMNHKYADQFSPQQRAVIDEILARNAESRSPGQHRGARSERSHRCS